MSQWVRTGFTFLPSVRTPSRHSDTVPQIVAKINADINEALRRPEMLAHLAEWSGEAIGGTPQATAAYMREEIERWHKVIKAANVKLEQ